MVTDPSSKVGVRLYARLKEAGLADGVARALADELCESFATRQDLAQTDELREAWTDAKISISGRNFILVLVMAVVLSGVVGRIIWGGGG